MARPLTPRVLLVDDRRDNLLALTAVLESLDVELVQAGSGEEALRRLLAEEFAVIVLDVQMPVLDGFETARLIKQREKTRHIPIVFLTAISGQPEHHLRGYASGAVDYVYKPFAPEILRAKVAVFAELWQRGAVIEQQRQELAARVADLDRANEALARQGLELERSNAALERFAEVAAHELRRPLDNVAGFLDLLMARHHRALGEDAALLAERAVKGVTDMRSLTRSLLDYAKTGAAPLDLEPVPLGEALADARRELASLLDVAGATVQANGLPTVRGDRRLLARVFTNLLDNAVKYRSDAPVLVRVSAEPDRDRWKLVVRDNGSGVDPADVARLFTVFARIRATQDRPGHGVGLAVCRRIIERHGGSIWCEPLEDGTAICFTLPREPAP